MHGLDKKHKALFTFDLETDLKKDPEKAGDLIKATEDKIQEIKDILRKDHSSEEMDEYGVLLQGYVALQKVLKRISPKK